MDDTRRAVLLKLRRWCLIVACIACAIQAFFEFVPDDAPPPTKTVTLAVGQQIGSILDLYSPLLGPFCAARASCDQVPAKLVYKAPDEDLANLYLRFHPGDEDWVFYLIEHEVFMACTLGIKCGLGPAGNISDVCRGLSRSLHHAQEMHEGIAHSLGGPHRSALWVTRIAFRLLDFLGDLEAAAAHPLFTLYLDLDSGGNMLTRPSPDEAAAGELGTRYAQALRLLVAEQGRWQSFNRIIRRDLLSLRGNCSQIVEALELVSQDCHPQGWSRDAHAIRTTATRVSAFIPHLKHMISAIDDIIVAIDAVQGRVMALETLLDVMTNAGWRSEEHIDGEDWRIIFRLPPPWDISRPIDKWLERMESAETYEAKAPLEHLPTPAGWGLAEAI